MSAEWSDFLSEFGWKWNLTIGYAISILSLDTSTLALAYLRSHKMCSQLEESEFCLSKKHLKKTETLISILTKGIIVAQTDIESLLKTWR